MPPALPPFDPSLEVVLASHGMSKGLGQTDGPQLLVTGRARHGDVSLVVRAKNLTSSGADAEINGGVIWARKLGRIEVELSASAKAFVGAPSRVDRLAAEFEASVGHSVGAVTPKLKLSVSPDDLGVTRASLFSRIELTWRIGSRWRLSGQAGRRDRAGGPDYAMGDVGINFSPVKQLLADLRLHATSRPALGEPYRRRLVASLRATF